MKKLVTLLAVFVFIAGAKAQYVNIPDSNFRHFLQQQYSSCFNDVGQMDTACTAILSEDTLVLPIYTVGAASRNINGIQYFKALKYFDCSYSYVKAFRFYQLH